MQYQKVTKYILQFNTQTILLQFNEMQFNTIQYDKIADNTFQTKTEHYCPQKEPVWTIGARKRPAEQLNGHLLENRRYAELPQDKWKL